jgi:hypothetical protein
MFPDFRNFDRKGNHGLMLKRAEVKGLDCFKMKWWQNVTVIHVEAHNGDCAVKTFSDELFPRELSGKSNAPKAVSVKTV